MLFTLIVSCYLAFLPNDNFVPPHPPGPVVHWLTEQDHDFGDVRSGKTMRFKFQYKNISTEPLILQTVRTTCGCTAAEWTEAPVAPGESGEVLIEFESSQSGVFRKKIRVFFDHQRKPEILWVEGEVM